MESVNLWFFHGLGYHIGSLHELSGTHEKLNSRPYSAALGRAKDMLTTLHASEIPILKKTKGACKELLEAIQEFEAVGAPDRQPNILEFRLLNDAISRFHSIMEQEMTDMYVYCLTPVGAYSIDVLVEKAHKHLSKAAQHLLNDEEKWDYDSAGICLALDLYTACGFHAMRALESEARSYHKLVTGVEMNDTPLGAVINGDRNYKDSGLINKFIAEGSKKDSRLGLVISLLSHINKIYRCPIMHPEMTLNFSDAKQVFDIAAVAISAMIEDEIERNKPAQPPAAAAAGGNP